MCRHIDMSFYWFIYTGYYGVIVTLLPILFVDTYQISIFVQWFNAQQLFIFPACYCDIFMSGISSMISQIGAINLSISIPSLPLPSPSPSLPLVLLSQSPPMLPSLHPLYLVLVIAGECHWSGYGTVTTWWCRTWGLVASTTGGHWEYKTNSRDWCESSTAAVGLRMRFPGAGRH